MPRPGGEETVRAWRRLRPNLPIILMSGFIDNALAEHLVDVGVSALLQKPFTLAE